MPLSFNYPSLSPAPTTGDLAVTDFLGEVASQVDMLNLSGQRGDWCTRTDIGDGQDFILTGDDPSLLANWRAAQVDAAPSALGVKSLYESNPDTNAFTDAEKTKLGTVESGATADMSGAEIKAAYEAEVDTNAFTDAEKAKLSTVESGAQVNRSAAQLKIDYEANPDTNSFTDAEKTKLADTETSAHLDVRDSANRNRANHTGTQPVSTLSNPEALPISAAQAAVNLLKADLVSGKVPISQLPDSFSGVAINPSLATFPVTGEDSTLYLAEDTKILYFWDGATYVDFIENTAQLNARDTANRARANHTGTQAQSTVVGLETDLADRLSKSAGGTVAGSVVAAGGLTRTNTSTFADSETLTVKQLFEIIGGFGQTEYVGALRNCDVASSGTGNANIWRGGERWQPACPASGDKVVITPFDYINAGTGSGSGTYFSSSFSVGFSYSRILRDGQIMRVNIGQLPSLGITAAAQMSTAIRGAQLEVRNIGGVYNGRFNFADGTDVQLGAWTALVSNPINGSTGTATFPDFTTLNMLEIEVAGGVISLVASMRQPGNGSVYTNRYFSTTLPTSAPNMLNGGHGSHASVMSISFEQGAGLGGLPEIGSFFAKYPLKF